MSDEYQYKILRLNTGEDIIGACLFDTETNCVNIENPMKFFVRRMVEVRKSILIVIPWLPLEVVASDSAIIDYDDVLTVIDPKDSFVDYYLSMVEHFVLEQLDGTEGQILEDDFFGNSDEEFSVEEVEEESNLQEIFGSVNKAKKGLLH